MAQQTINISTPDSNAGDTIRDSFDKCNDNFTELYASSGGNLDQVTTAGNTTTNSITVGGLTVDTDTLFVDSTNNRVGIGTTSPTAKLDIQGDGADFFLQSADFKIARIQPRGTGANLDKALFSLFDGSAENVRIDTFGNSWLNGGNVGIGTTSPSSPLTVKSNSDGSSSSGITVIANGSADAIFKLGEKDGNGARLHMYDGGVEKIAFYTDGSDNHISTGNVLIGTQGTPDGTSNYGSAFITGGNSKKMLYLATSVSTADGLVRFYNSNGQVGSISVGGSSTTYATSSDYRLKENVVPMQGALDRVDALKPSRFNFIADADKTVDGFLAHEVADVVPEAISGEKDATEEYEVTPAVLDDEGNVIEEAIMGTRPVYQGIDQSKLVPLLVGAIQELRAEIKTLKSQIQ